MKTQRKTQAAPKKERAELTRRRSRAKPPRQARERKGTYMDERAPHTRYAG